MVARNIRNAVIYPEKLILYNFDITQVPVNAIIHSKVVVILNQISLLIYDKLLPKLI